MQYSLRYNPPPTWRDKNNYNYYFFGLVELCKHLHIKFKDQLPLNMLEIGSYKGESTSIFAASGIFKKITCIDPHLGEEKALEIFDDNWGKVKKEFWTNTRYYDNIKLIQSYSYQVSDNFKDREFDFVYIDASHDYFDVEKDLELYLPKTKLIIGGHDYSTDHMGVIDAVNGKFGAPDRIFEDSSWVKYL